MRRRGPTPWPRFALLGLGMSVLVVGIAGGLLRLGWPLPVPLAAAWHGPLMLCGFFGVVIGLERAVAVGQAWAYGSPVFSGLGAWALLAGQAQLGFAGFALGSAVLLAATVAAARRQPEPFMGVLALAVVAALFGQGLWWLGAPLRAGLLPAFAFLVLTITAERLELSRYVPRPPQAGPLLAAIVLVLLAALALPEPWDAHAFGLGLVALAAWLGAWDLARNTVRQRGLPRFVAVALLLGYVQLLAAGLLLARCGLQAGTASYDAALHVLGLGFIFSMVFGHAPVIAPAVLRVQLRYHAVLYLPLAVLHASLLLRGAGLALEQPALRRQSGLVSAAAIGSFVLLLVLLNLFKRSRRSH